MTCMKQLVLIHQNIGANTSKYKHVTLVHKQLPFLLVQPRISLKLCLIVFQNMKYSRRSVLTRQSSTWSLDIGANHWSFQHLAVFSEQALLCSVTYRCHFDLSKRLSDSSC